MFFNKTVKNINRIRQMINILAKYGFEDVVITTPLRKLISSQSQADWLRRDKPVFEYSRWERIRMVIEELGPTYIKFAQLLSNRPDLLPEPLILEFEKLQNNVPPFDTALAKEIFSKELNKPIEEVFSYFDELPIGSASIGQVHRARLYSGEDVVVKIQRPGAQTKVEIDLGLIYEFVRLTENFFRNLGILNPLDVVKAFEESMRLELDYTYELRHMEQFRKIYHNQSSFQIPKPYKELSGMRVLTTEFISGCKITDVNQMKAWGLQPEAMVEKGLNIYLSQIFENGFFHADPHPGNILVKPNGTIVLLDFGMVGKMTKQEKYAFSGVFISLAQHDARGMAASLRKLAIDDGMEDFQGLEADLDRLIDDLVVLDTGDSGMKELTEQLQRIIYKYSLKVPGSVFLILRALAILEGIGKALHPDFDTFEVVKPYGLKQLTEQFSFENVSTELSITLSQIGSLIYKFPGEAKMIMTKLRKGELNFHVEFNGLDKVLEEIDSVANRLSITLIICALIIFSGISLTVDFSKQIPAFLGISYVSFSGLVITLVLVIILLVLTIRKRQKP